MKVPESECSWERILLSAKVPVNESSWANSLRGTKVPESELARERKGCESPPCSNAPSTTPTNRPSLTERITQAGYTAGGTGMVELSVIACRNVLGQKCLDTK